MNAKTPENYERYVAGLFAREDEALLSARADTTAGGLPEIAVSATEGKLLYVLARLARPRRILEIGTLGGYSAICLARALPPGGRMISLELDPHHAEVARGNLLRAGFGDRVEIRVGPALESLAAMSGEEPFDLVFIDADKDGYVDYLRASLPLLRSGGLLLGDNTLPDAVLDEAGDSGTKRYNAAAAASPELESILVPVFRRDGLDGLLVSVKR